MSREHFLFNKKKIAKNKLAKLPMNPKNNCRIAHFHVESLKPLYF